MATRVAMIAHQALILLFLGELCICFSYGQQDRRAKTPQTTNEPPDFVSIEKKRIKYLGLPDATVLARCKSFIAQFQSLLEKLKKQNQLNAHGFDGPMARSMLVEPSKITRRLDPSVYLQCKKYTKRFTESPEKFSSNKESNGSEKPEVPKTVKSRPHRLSSGAIPKSHALLKNKERQRYAFLHRLQERMVRTLVADSLEVPDLNVTVFQRIIHLVKHVLGITVVLLAIACVVTYFYSDAHCNSKVTGLASARNTSGVPKTPAEVPLLSVEKARENIRGEQQWQSPLSLEEAKYARLSSKDSQTREDEATIMPVPRSAQLRTMIRTEMRPVREKVQSEVEDPQRTRATLELLGLTFPKNTKLYLPNYIDKGYKECKTNADWPHEETAHQASPELQEVKEFAERSRRLH